MILIISDNHKFSKSTLLTMTGNDSFVV